MVAVVTDRSKHGHRAVCDCKGKAVIVETGKVQTGPASAKDKNGIVLPCRLDRLKCVDDTLRRRFSLHCGGEKIDPELEPVLVIFEMTAEIPVAGGIRGGDDGKSGCYTAFDKRGSWSIRDDVEYYKNGKSVEEVNLTEPDFDKIYAMYTNVTSYFKYWRSKAK